MVGYRRNLVKGGTYFFTVTLADRRASILTEQVDQLRTVMRSVRHDRPFEIVAMVVLPEHLHAIWTLPEGDADFPGRWKAIKAGFTRALVENGTAPVRGVNGEYGIWQRRYWEHTVRDEVDLSRHVDYIHFNPVKHGLVKHVKDWPWSSFHRYVEKGCFSPDWAGSDEVLNCGEP